MPFRKLFVAGDQVLFKRGSSWSGTLTISTSGTVRNNFQR